MTFVTWSGVPHRLDSSSSPSPAQDRFAYLALEPNLNSDMEPVIRRVTPGEVQKCDTATLGMTMFSLQVTDACKWTLVHADGEMSGKPVQL